MESKDKKVFIKWLSESLQSAKLNNKENPEGEITVEIETDQPEKNFNITAPYYGMDPKKSYEP